MPSSRCLRVFDDVYKRYILVLVICVQSFIVVGVELS